MIEELEYYIEVITSNDVNMKAKNLSELHDYFTRTPFFFLLNSEDRATVNECFDSYPHENLSRIERTNLSKFSIEIQHKFFSQQLSHVSDEYKWESLSEQERNNYNRAFKKQGLPPQTDSYYRKYG